jgi:parvulin-like peptidyl-prolyl isomerase
MRRLAVLLALAVLPSRAVSGAERVERLLVRVNDSIITQSAFDLRLARAKKEVSPGADEKKFRLGILELMIRELLIDDRAARLELTVSEAELDEAIARVKEQYGLKSQEDFEKALAGNGMTLDDLKAQLHEQLLTNKVLSREVPIGISDDAVRTEYEKIKEKQYSVPERAKVSEIVVRFDPSDSASREAALARIEEAQKRIAGGTPFADVAREYSNARSRERGGDLGWVSRGDLAPELDSAIFGGDVSKPIATRDAYHLLAVSDREKAGFRPFDDVKEDIRKRLSAEVYDKKFDDYLRDLRKAAYVKIFDAELASLDEEFNSQKPAS